MNYYLYQCNTCSSKDECLSCINQYELYHDKSKCVYEKDTTYYKSLSDGLYYLCSEAIQNCEKCELHYSSFSKCQYCEGNYDINQNCEKCINHFDI